jgi:hypothetical protein
VNDDRPSFGQALSDSGLSDSGGFDSPAETVTPDAENVSASSADDTPLTGQPEATPIASPEAGASPSTPAPRGPIPFERHEAVLKNTRTEYEQKLAALSWAQDIPPEKAAQVAAFVEQAAGNRVAFAKAYIEDLLQDPSMAAEIRSFAARTLGTRPAQPQQPPQVAAGPDLGPVLEIDGIPLPTKAQREAQEQDLIRRVVDAVTQEVGGRIAPVESVAQALAQAKKDQAENEARVTSARSLMETASKWEGWAEHKAELAAALNEARQQPGYDDTDPAKMGQILRDLYIERVVPKLRTTAQAGLLRDLKTRAGELGSSPAGAKNGAAVAHARPTWDNVFSTI